MISPDKADIYYNIHVAKALHFVAPNTEAATRCSRSTKASELLVCTSVCQ